ncbi:protein phosphatase regulator [Tilletia horrida]|nr:protein phosphatase regulator [Tilletia horrida]
MLSAPAPYPTVSSSIPAPDDAQIVPSHRLPSICVDYLSHNWARDEDVWNSWKAMTKSKNEIANGVRLENASWRTWMKQMRKLKTVSPETLNWLKDSDVTWLYGPLHQGQVEAVPAPKVASTAERLDLVENTRPPTKNAHSTSAQSLSRNKLSNLGADSPSSPDPSTPRSPSSSGQNGASSSLSATDGSRSTPTATATAAKSTSSIAPAAAGTASSAAGTPPTFKKTLAPHRVNSDGHTMPPATKSILKHRTIQDLLSNPQANSAAGVGSALGLRSASQPSLPELEAAAAATSLALRDGNGEAVLSPSQARALGLIGGVSGGGAGTPEIHTNPSSSLASPPIPNGSGLVSPPAGQAGSSLSLASDGDAASSLKSPTASAASLVSLSSVGSGTQTTERSSRISLPAAANKSAVTAVPERRHISFNQRVEQCIALDMDQVQDYPSSDEEVHGEYGYGDHRHEDDDDDDEEESIRWRSGPGQRVQRRPRYDEDDEEEMLTINVRSGTGGRPGSSSGGSSTSTTSFSARSRSSGSQHQHHHFSSSGGSGARHPRTIAKLAPTMLRGGSAQPETGEWLDHEESDAHDVDIHAGVGPGMVHSGVGTGANAHIAAYVHNPIVNVDHRQPHQQDGVFYESGGGAHHYGPEAGEGEGVGDDDDRGRAPEPTRVYGTPASAHGGRVHQSGRGGQHGSYSGGSGDSYEFGSDGGSDWENRTSLDLASPTFPASPAGEEADEDDEEEDWESEGGAARKKVPADDVALRGKTRGAKAAGAAGSSSGSGGGGGGRSRGGGAGSSSRSDFWADGDANEGGYSQGGKGRRAPEPPSPASSTSSSYSASKGKSRISGGGSGSGNSSPGGGGAGGERRRQSSTEVALEDRAVHGVLSIDVDNVPSNDPNSPVNPAHGPTPLNTPTFMLKPGKGASKSATQHQHQQRSTPSKSQRSRRGQGSASASAAAAAAAASSASAAFDDEDDEDDYDPALAVLPHRRTSTGALVAPKNRQVQVPLAHDYVDEGDEGGLINRAVEMINTARDLFGALWGAGDSDRGRSWRDSTFE